MSENRVAELFGYACDLESHNRSQFLERECQGRPDLLAQVNSLLDADQQAIADDFLSEPALNIEARVVASTATLSRSGQMFGRYHLIEPIGEGGMGEVYLANDTQLDRKVAVKLVKSQLTTSEVLRRFHNERQILAHLNHPNIATLLDSGTTDDGLPYFVMEFVEGKSIDQYADEETLSTKDRLELFRTVCDAVQSAHQNLVVHRDIKPGNILVNKNGVPKLLDFGIEKLLATDKRDSNNTLTVFRAMTPEYASPEQIKGEPITTATDVYSLGVVLYELLTGQSPYHFKSRKSQDIADAICLSEPVRPSRAISTNETNRKSRNVGIGNRQLSSSDLDNIVLKAMRKEPERRYVSVNELSEDIRRHLSGQPVIARKDTFTYRTSKFVQRHKFGVTAAGLTLILLLAGIAATGWEARRARLEKARAERRFNDVRRLANSFMFEFHDSIKDVPGTLQARQLLVKRALEYLDDLSQEANDDESLKSELAIAYDRLGDITFDVDQALAIHDKARSLNESLVKAHPKSDQYRKQLAVSYERSANLAKQRGDTQTALDYTNKEVAISESLFRDFPDNIEYRSALVDSYMGLTISLEQTGDLKAALTYAMKAVEFEEQIVAEEPGNPERRRDLAVAFSFVCNALELDGNYSEALAAAHKEESLEETVLASDKTNARYLRDRWVSLVRQGRLLTKSGNAHEGIDYLDRALNQIDQLAKADPSDKGHQRGLAMTHLTRGQALEALGRKDAAIESYSKALAVSQALLDADPKKMETRTDLAQMYSSRGGLLTELGRTDFALVDLRKAVELVEAASHADPTNVRLKGQLAEIYGKVGDACMRMAHSSSENWKVARDWEQKSLNIWDELRGSGKASGADSSRIDQVSRNLAVCDAAIALQDRQ
ncbi:MAG: hypothetical protein DMF69_05875 [Acidobacteria bacterium]|nr:MAG: hypothetical protein DMF69_05875 [Acidobacteriota bacterium]